MIADEYPDEKALPFDNELVSAYTRLRARAIELEREVRFLQWQLAVAQERWDDARKLEREGALDHQAKNRILSNAP